MLYHYTTFETLLRIFENVTIENDQLYISLRATRIDKVNDPTEMKIDLQLLKSILQEYEIQKSIENNKCLSNTIEPQMYDKIINDLNDEKSNHPPYVICFSTRNDYLPMWSLYGEKHHGACLCFDEYAIINITGDLIKGKVIYNRKQKSEVIKSVLDLCYNNIVYKDHRIHDIDDRIFELFLFVSTFIKNNNYAYEKEYRMCLYNFRSFTDSQLEDVVMYDKNADYVDIKMPLSSLKRVLLGAKLPNSLLDIMNKYFNEKYHIKFRKSKIPFI